MRSGDERHAKARIRHAAIVRFGRDGFDVGLRAIAADAEVSPALIVHHFGSKAGLRQACDDHVLAVIADAKLDTVGAAGPSAMLAQLAGLDEYAPYAAYAVASLAAGGDLARELVDRMAAMTEDFLADGVTEGTIKPSRDPRGRARYLTYTGLGMLLLAYRMRADSAEPPDLEGAFAALTEETVGPALELYTEGLFTDASFLDAYAAGDPPPGADRNPAADRATGADRNLNASPDLGDA